MLMMMLFFSRYVQLSLKGIREARNDAGGMESHLISSSLIGVGSAAIMGLTAVSIWLNLLWYVVGLGLAAINIGRSRREIQEYSGEKGWKAANTVFAQ